MHNLVSIITPAYNSARHITDTVKSVQAQSYPHWEMVITDDASRDGTWPLLQRLAEEDPRIRVFQLPHNGGPAKARNNSIQQAKGRFIAFLDSDDVWYPQALEKMMEFMAAKQAAFAFAAYDISYGDGPVIETRHVPASIDYRGLLKDRPISCLTAMYDTKTLGKIYMPELRKRQDYALWLKILRTGITAHGLATPIACYRKQPGSVSSNIFSSALYVWRVFRQSERLALLPSVYYFGYYLISTLWSTGKRRLRKALS